MATKQPVAFNEGSQLTGYQWGPVTSADTIAPVFWKYGGGALSVDGVLNGASVTWTFSPTQAGTQRPMNTDPAPAGGVVSGDASTSVRTVVLSQNAPPGWISATISGGGASQSATLILTKPVQPHVADA